MVPVYVLLVALPFAACGMSNGMDSDNMQMLQMMMNNMNMNNMKNMQQNQGWGNMQMNMNNNQQMQQAPNFSMQNKEEYDLYMKWCAENKLRNENFQKQQELLDSWKAKMKHQKEQSEKNKHEMEAHEREENMKAQWKAWEKKMEMAQSFDHVGYELMEMKHKYYYTITMSFLQFCKCSDFADNIEKFFHHDGVDTSKMEEFDLADLGLDANQSQDPVQVARAINALSQGDQIKAFFGGLAGAMCEGAKSYYDQVHQWEEQYKFLERLV